MAPKRKTRFAHGIGLWPEIYTFPVYRLLSKRGSYHSPQAGGAGVSTQTLGKPTSATSLRRHGMSLPQADGVGVTATILRPSEKPCNRVEFPEYWSELGRISS